MKHKVVVVGAGFAGLQAIMGLKGLECDITLVDQRNHHLFQPLLYQVATTVLSTSDIAWPIRAILRDRKDVMTCLATVEGVDRERKVVQLHNGDELPYDTLILATGARHAYFGRDAWESVAPGLKTLEDATTIRRRVLLSFERAEETDDFAEREALLTFAIIGAGPTGVELAGIIAELAHRVLPEEFRRIDTRKSRILLIEAGPRILPSFSQKLSDYAARSLKKRGVEVLTGHPVTDCSVDGIVLNGQHIPSRTIIWAAGVQASKAGAWLDAETDRAGRVIVGPELTLPGDPSIFILGDTAHVESNGKQVPGVAPAAKQQGDHAARTIRARLTGKTAPGPFRYRDMGNLATIGRNAAVIEYGKFKLKGWLAWWVWGIAHIYFLIGTRSRIFVAISWLWVFLSGQSTARLITQGDIRRRVPEPKDPEPKDKEPS